jgi:hypothetical protein
MLENLLHIVSIVTGASYCMMGILDVGCPRVNISILIFDVGSI